ncbi:MAG: beta-ketoacyl synthase chain length factor [Sulfurovum sp.]|nr:beta-ketoacyl synthase chain length factor [Sulfurovum sp.]
MKNSVRLEVIESAYVYGNNEIEDLNIKELVPKMMTRRRLTRAAKIAIYLSHKVLFSKGRIVYGSSFGELPATASILNAISAKESISPTHFQNSVYNTAISYLSILSKNEEELLTISSGDKTASNVLKVGAVKALDGDTLLLLVTETLNIDGIDKVNVCEQYLECAVALKVQLTQRAPTLKYSDMLKDSKVPTSMTAMMDIAKQCEDNKMNVIEVQL